jgi:biopolymer transport protein ExbB
MMRVLSLLAVASLSLAGTANTQSVEDAFRRERAHLEAERDALAAEDVRFDAGSAADVATAERRLAELRSELDAVRTRLARAADIRGDATSGYVESALLAHTAHAERVLDSPAVSAPTVERGKAALEFALDRLEQGTRVEWVDGEYFLPDGKRATGRVLQLGAVAQVTEIGGMLTPLVPVDGDALEARVDRAAPAGAGGVPVVVAGEEGIERSGRRSFADTIRAGGLIVWPILALAALGLIIVFERLITIARLEKGRGAMDEIVAAAAGGDFAAADKRAADAGGSGGRVLAAGLSERARGVAAVDDALSESLIRESARFHRFLPIIRVIAAVSPLLGLLGTVTGMISTFDAITTYGTGDPKLLSGGISEALITTELGLIVAIPFLFVHNILAGRVQRNVSELEERGLGLSRALSNGALADGARLGSEG